MKNCHKTGRNGPCHCGSGKKYKKCHEAEDKRIPLPVEFCRVNDDFEQSGLAVVLVARAYRIGDKLNLVVYLCDTFCLGVKDVSLYPAADKQTIDATQEKYLLDFVDIDYEAVRGLVLGAVQYARNLGFQPQGSWHEAQQHIESDRIFDSERYSYGRDGKPFYVTGPHDNYQQIFSTLENAVGRGNFDYLIDERSHYIYAG